MIEILRPGPLTTVQDLGRPGHADLGVGRSGAADRVSFRLANRLVGNPESAAALEVTFGGLVLRAEEAVLVALAGAPCPITTTGVPGRMNGPFFLAAGETLELGRPERGLRTYLAVRGGIDVPPVLGSRATDVLADIGPPPLTPGRRLAVGVERSHQPNLDLAPVAALPDRLTLRIIPGPRDDWFTDAALAALTTEPFTVTPDCNRVGVRLAGPRLERARAGELAPEGMVCGALQVPASGQPVLFLADHPLTGGYPVIAVVHAADLALAAQARPGDPIRFTWSANS